MEIILIKLFYFVRPFLGVQVDFSLLGLNFLEFSTIVFTIVLGLIYVTALLSKRNLPVSAIEMWIIIFVLWCTLTIILNHELSVFKSYIKLILPPITFLILKRTIPNRDIYVICLHLAIIGFFIPITLSTLLTFQGLGLDEEIFQTGTKRYKGVYNAIHEMGHSTGLCIMLIFMYIAICKAKVTKISILKYSTLTLLFLLALYCLVHTHVRTVYVGLTVFILIFLFFYSKKGLILFIASGSMAAIIFFSVIQTVFFDVLDTKYTGANYERAGSGRTSIWEHNIDIWLDAPVDKKISGLGIGNWVGNRKPTPGDKVKQIFNSHNDWLEVLLETGIIGFIIILGLYISIFLSVNRLNSREKYAFLAFILAVAVMNTLSNSYISRFPLAQLFFMVLVYIEIPANKISSDNLSEKCRPTRLSRRLPKKVSRSKRQDETATRPPLSPP